MIVLRLGGEVGRSWSTLTAGGPDRVGQLAGGEDLGAPDVEPGGEPVEVPSLVEMRPGDPVGHRT
ncbi:MAG: hypothetical protein H0V32_02945 [Nocardioidaceae bacterium]|nr:hypothetical protein [Nocardioidaceae bacterium]